MTVSATVSVTATVNGVPVQAQVPPRLTLADFLRDVLGLTGTHLGCEHGVCGACSVLVDGRSARACLLLAAQVDGADVVTVEGLERHETAERLRKALTHHHGLQCGFCTPGIVVTATELLEDASSPKPLTEESVREALSGNVCRCTGYQGIVRAVLEAAEQCRPAEEPAAGESGDDEEEIK